MNAGDQDDRMFLNALDNAIVGMSLLLARLLLRRMKVPRPVKDMVAKRLDFLIEQYGQWWTANVKGPIAHDAQWKENRA